MRMRSGSWSLFALGLISSALYAGPPLCGQNGETYPETPFALQVRLATTEAAVGDRVEAEYALTNLTDRPVAGCAEGWHDFNLWGTVRVKGWVTTSVCGSPVENAFRLPPHSTLIWKSQIEVLDVGTGPARLVGLLSSGCGLWSGTVRAEPVPLTILPAKPK